MISLLFILFVSGDDRRADVIQLLDRSDVPVIADAFTQAAGGDPTGVLTSIVRDDELHPSLRLAAVSALTWFRSPIAKDTLKQLAETGISPLRKSAVYALGRDYKTAPDTFTTLVSALDDQEAAVRKAAARMLATQPHGKPILTEHVRKEHQASIRELIEKLLKQG